MSKPTYGDLLVALRGLTNETQLSRLNIRKDFSWINAHAYAVKLLHQYDDGEEFDLQIDSEAQPIATSPEDVTDVEGC
jgi:hypothetical protein